MTSPLAGLLVLAALLVLSARSRVPSRSPVRGVPAEGSVGSRASREDRHPGHGGPGLPLLHRPRHGVGGIELHELPLFVHQLAGLLRAGRPPHGLWADMQRVHAEGSSAFSAAAAPVIAAACRAASLGLSVPSALRQAAAPVTRPSKERHECDRMWVDLAGCLEVAQRSGAPLAGILDHYAVQLDAHLDGVAARETALAGPRATVVLLAWLPVVGLGLGFGLGINPIGLLTSSPLGLLSLASGALLMVASRFWSGRLITRAAGTAR